MELLPIAFNLCVKYQLWNCAIGLAILTVLIKTDKKQALLHQDHKNDIDENRKDINKVDKKYDKLEFKVEKNTTDIGHIKIYLAEKFKKQEV